MTHRWLLSIVVAAVFAGASAGGAVAFPGAPPPALAVGGAVATPGSYSLTALGALPQATFSVTQRSWWGSRTYTDTGVPVEDLVNDAQPTEPITKNALLRVTVTVSGQWGRSVTFALGELDQGFGDHAAYLALKQDGHTLPAPELIVPGDVDAARSIASVNRITVGVQNPTPTTPPAGAVTIEDGGFTRTLSEAQLASLPQRTLNVSFLAGTAAQSHTEIGPTLDAVLRAARIRLGLDTWVAAVGDDGYVATVTPAEAWVGGRPLLISLNEDGTALAQPRLVTDGDVKGGRYVSGVVDLVVGQALAPFGPQAWSR
jgi:DMSO/TMAO reductase YedYZ molybdopterin-dependent catalytic subunit